MSNIFELIAKLENEIKHSPKPRISGGNKRIVDCDRMLDILGDLKVSIPDEIRQAQAVLTEKNNLLEEARNTASSLMSDARLQSERMISQEGVLEEARNRGEQIVLRAEENADIIAQGARTYTDEILSDVQRYLEEYIAIIENNRRELQVAYQTPEPEIVPEGTKPEEAEADAVEAEVPSHHEEKEATQGEAEEHDPLMRDDLFGSKSDDLRQGIEIEVDGNFFGADIELEASTSANERTASPAHDNRMSADDEIAEQDERFPWL
jgi:hypothetical protein